MLKILKNKVLMLGVGVFLLMGSTIAGSVFSSNFLFRDSMIGARTSTLWSVQGGTYIKTAKSTGYNILINGTNKYINFNTTSGTSGYGFRDNAGTIEYKDSSGSWIGFAGISGTVDQLGQVGDVATNSPMVWGDLLQWTGSGWTIAATSSLGITAAAAFSSIATLDSLMSGESVASSTGNTSIVTVGTITTGTWQTEIEPEYIALDEIGTATYDDVQDWYNTTQSAGKISGGTATDGGSGAASISAMKGIFKTTDSEVGANVNFDYAGGSIGLKTGETDYIYLKYNGGTPILATTTVRSDISGTDEIAIGIGYYDGTIIHAATGGIQIQNLGKRTHQRAEEMDGFKRSSGMVISETGTRGLSMTAGVYWRGNTRFPAPASSSITWTYWFNDGAWKQSKGSTTVDNIQYNDYGVGLADLTANQYGAHYVYMHHEFDYHVVYGIDSYNLAEALAVGTPANLPDLVSAFSVPLAKIIVKKSATNFYSVTTLFDDEVGQTPVTDHGGLGGLTDQADHPWALYIDGANAMTGHLTMTTGSSTDLTATNFWTDTINSYFGADCGADNYVYGVNIDGTLDCRADQISAGANNYGVIGAMAYYAAAGYTATGTDPAKLYWDETNGDLGIGTSTPGLGARLNVLGTTEQLRLAYDRDSYTTFTVDSNGDIAIDAVGDNVNFNSNNVVLAGDYIATNFYVNTITIPNAPAFSMNTDTNTGMYLGGSDTIGLSTNAISVLFIDADQEVGIGTTTPDTKLTVLHAGNQLKLSFDSTDNAIFAVDTDGDLTITASGDEIKTAENIIATGKGDFGDGILEVTNSAALFTNSIGDIGVDSTDGQLRYNDGTATRTIAYDFKILIAEASSTLAYYGAYGAAGTTTMEYTALGDPWTIVDVASSAKSGTTSVSCGDGTNWMSFTLGGEETGYTSITPSANNTFTADENYQCRIGTQEGDPKDIYIRIKGTWDVQ